MFPSSLVFSELQYSASSRLYEGSFSIPQNMSFPYINGSKSISPVTDFHDGGDYITVLYFTVVDSEGGTVEHYILLSVEAPETDTTLPGGMDLILILIIIGVLVGVIVLIAYLFKKSS